jgi:hypothetical protein
MRPVLSLAFAASLLTVAQEARADGLVVYSREFGSWTESIARLEQSGAAAAQTLHVGVRDDHSHPLACGGYRLSFDAIGARAFVPGACDPATGLTELRLTRRAALFTRGPDGTRVGVGVRLSAIATASEPPSLATAPSAVATSPEDPDGITDLPAIALAAGGPIRESRVATTCDEAPAIGQGVTVDGTTLDGSQRPVYRLHLGTRTSLRFDVSSSFGGEIDLYDACPDGLTEIAYSSVFGVGPRQRLSWDLPAGDYFVVVVDADIHPHRGRYVMRTELQHDYLALVP